MVGSWGCELRVEQERRRVELVNQGQRSREASGFGRALSREGQTRWSGVGAVSCETKKSEEGSNWSIKGWGRERRVGLVGFRVGRGRRDGRELGL